MKSIAHTLKSWVYDTYYVLEIHVLKNWIVIIAITIKYEDDNFYMQIHALKRWIMITSITHALKSWVYMTVNTYGMHIQALKSWVTY